MKNESFQWPQGTIECIKLKEYDPIMRKEIIIKKIIEGKKFIKIVFEEVPNVV